MGGGSCAPCFSSNKNEMMEDPDGKNSNGMTLQDIAVKNNNLPTTCSPGGPQLSVVYSWKGHSQYVAFEEHFPTKQSQDTLRFNSPE